MVTNTYKYKIDDVNSDEEIRIDALQSLVAEAEQSKKVLEDFDPEEVLAYKRVYLVVKRIFDIIISLLAMIICCWIYAIIALMVRADRTFGPVIFKQTRMNHDMLSFDECVTLDLLYIQKCSFWTDFKLIIQTIGCMFMAQGT